MSLFDLVINIIESSIMCYFIYKYFDFKTDGKTMAFISLLFLSTNNGQEIILLVKVGWQLFYWLEYFIFVFEKFSIKK